MAEASATDLPTQKRSSKLPLIIGLLLALAGGAGGYLAVSGGWIGGGESPPEEKAKITSEMAPDVAFLPMDPLTISLPSGSSGSYLRFRGELEVHGAYAEEVSKYMPRFVDVLNTYLRALEVRDLEDPAALGRLRSQMLRRVQMVAGPDRISDLLIMEFVLQ
ncbi:flagellar basal body-associated FliL family protein [Roseobacter ponti]|uniref:Flagellar protein FliL n=1 Tax=Roseobacter ponti TaxID=1891787 RepID=A0A858SY94_9RHOB|nr:flagellar basal body-associated FliL family protein [Roseobacter ponti]QJF52968.1 flagellar basal body protein FliL [Roseobacter ponti]